MIAHKSKIIAIFFLVFSLGFVGAIEEISTVTLTSDSGNNLTIDNLTAYIIPYNSSQKYIHNWKKDGNSIAVLNLPFEGGSTSSFTKDYSDYSDNGTVVNAIWDSSTGYDGFGAYEFGADSYITISDLETINNFTFTTKIKPNFDYDDNSSTVSRLFVARVGSKTLLGGYSNTKDKFTLTQRDNSGWLDTGNLVSATHVRALLESSEGTLYAATTPNGDVFKSTNGGVSWINTGDLAGVSTITSLIESSDGILYAGTTSNGAVFSSTDGGIIWTNTGDLLDADHVWSLLEDSDGNLYAGTYMNGDVFKSINGGITWTNTGNLEYGGSEVDRVVALLQSSDGTLYAGTYAYNTPAGDGDVYKSTNGGTSWSNTGNLAGATQVWSLLESSDGTLYAATEPSGNVFKSTNGGVSWSNTGNLASATTVTSLLEASDGTLYAATEPSGNVFKSTNGGTSWSNTGNLAGASIVYALLESSDGVIYAGTTPNGNLFKILSNVLESSVQSLLSGEWVDLSFEMDLGGMAIFIDGTLDATNSIAVSPMTITELLIGGDKYNQEGDGGYKVGTRDTSFNGTIDEIVIYNRTLSDEQILSLYNNRTDMIVSQETVTYDVWQTCTTSNNRLEDGTQVCSNELTIRAYVIFDNVSVIDENGLTVSFVNKSGYVNTTGEILRGANVTFNTTITNYTEVDKLWIKIWEEDFDEDVKFSSFLTNIGNNMWTVTASTDLTFSNVQYAYTIYGNVTSGEDNYVEGTFDFDYGFTVEFVNPTPNNESVINITSVTMNISSVDELREHYTLLDLDSSLLAWYRFENDTGDFTEDSSSYGNDLVKDSGINYNHSAGRLPYGMGVEFNIGGTDGGADSTNSISLKNTGWTIGFWVSPTSGIPENEELVGIGGGNNIIVDFDTEGESGGCGTSMYDIIQVGIGGTYHEIICHNFDVNDIDHVTIVYDGTQLMGYRNGISEKNKTQSIGNYSGKINIAEGPLNYEYDGWLDEIVIFNRSLSASEVKSLYEATANQYVETFNLTEGEHKILAQSVNEDGVMIEDERTFEIDLTPLECPPIPQNWEVNMADYLIVNEFCNLTSFNITFYGVGNFTINATILVDNLNNLSSGMEMWMKPDGLVYMGSD